MLYSKKGFTLIELLLVIAIIALLMSILMPALNRVKEQARTVGCMANLKDWAIVCTIYAESNNGKLWPGIDANGFYWPWQLEEKLKDWKKNKTWFCPTAQKPIVDENGLDAPTFNIWNAWGIYKDTQGGLSTGPNGIAGSYGLNAYLLSTPGRLQGWWGTFNVPQANNVPLFMDSLRFDLWPRSSNPAARNGFAAWREVIGDMGRCCIDRHDGFIGCAFADSSVRKVGLKELWTLKWNKTFDTGGIWTTAGGVQDSEWPEWIRSLPNY